MWGGGVGTESEKSLGEEKTHLLHCDINSKMFRLDGGGGGEGDSIRWRMIRLSDGSGGNVEAV